MLGVLGGMGPLATADFLAKVAAATPAARDQDHIPLVAWSVPQVPERVPAILGDGPSPLPAMLAGVRALRAAGAEAIAIACNTAHYWYDELVEQGGVPILHIADAALLEARRHAPQGRRIGLLATSGTLAAGFYQTRFQQAGYATLLPPADDQESLHQAIQRVKAGDIAGAAALAETVAQRLLAAGADVLVVGCTELPLALAGADTGLRARMVDATAALAAASVAWSRGPGTD
ncbi:MAG TPA: amino acid racemase [Burkholderiales bacterium]|nr:amino acid racemase [Burkholderiales bacterium]